MKVLDPQGKQEGLKIDKCEPKTLQLFLRDGFSASPKV